MKECQIATVIRLRTFKSACRDGNPRRAPLSWLAAGMPARLYKLWTRLSLWLCLVCVPACNLVAPTPLATSIPTPALPQAKILFPAHNQQVVEGVIFDIEILASDPAAGIQRVELYVDEQLQQTSETESGSAPDYRVTMNWYADEIGWHKFAVIAYRANGVASHPHIIALEVIRGG